MAKIGKNEYFDRRDLTMASSALDRRLLSTRIDDDYTECTKVTI